MKKLFKGIAHKVYVTDLKGSGETLFENVEIEVLKDKTDQQIAKMNGITYDALDHVKIYKAKVDRKIYHVIRLTQA